MAKRDKLAAVEHLKEYIRELLQALMDGSQGATMGVVCTRIWRALDETLAEEPGELCGTAHFRVEVAPSVGLPPKVDGELLSLRCVGPQKEGGPYVYYLVVKAGDYEEACEICNGFLAREFKVTAWQFFA
jgi:hypothetical protein